MWTIAYNGEYDHSGRYFEQSKDTHDVAGGDASGQYFQHINEAFGLPHVHLCSYHQATGIRDQSSLQALVSFWNFDLGDECGLSTWNDISVPPFTDFDGEVIPPSNDFKLPDSASFNKRTRSDEVTEYISIAMQA